MKRRTRVPCDDGPRHGRSLSSQLKTVTARRSKEGAPTLRICCRCCAACLVVTLTDVPFFYALDTIHDVRHISLKMTTTIKQISRLPMGGSAAGQGTL